jgi:hypothetical protein
MPIKCRPYRVSYAQQDTVNKMIDHMLTHKIISKSNSPRASPVVIVKKKDGSNRFCVVYRKLNNITIKDNYPIPIIEETLDTWCSIFHITRPSIRILADRTQ